jgi:hypothetical protein
MQPFDEPPLSIPSRSRPDQAVNCPGVVLQQPADDFAPNQSGNPCDKDIALLCEDGMSHGYPKGEAALFVSSVYDRNENVTEGGASAKRQNREDEPPMIGQILVETAMIVDWPSLTSA